MTSSSELHYPPPPSAGSLSGANDSGSESANGTPKLEPEGTGGLSPEPALMVIPEDQRIHTGARRRVFQSRRRSRACDACRLRKTKCDTPAQNGPCTSCIAASLVCRFSEAGDERRRAGPARRLRNLESTVRELTTKLEHANALLIGFGCPPITQAQPSRTLPTTPSATTTATEAQPPYPTAESTIGSAQSQSSRESFYHVHQPSVFPPPPGAAPFNYPPPGYAPEQGRPRIPTFPNVPGCSPAHRQVEGLLSSPEGPRTGANYNHGDGGHATWDGNFYGSSSTLFFMSSFRDYLERLGYALPPIRMTSPSSQSWQQGTEARGETGNESQKQGPERMRIDLRYLLPPKDRADKIKDIYWRSRQVYQPIFYWPMVERKWKRAWAEPIWDDDEVAVKGIFCIVMMFLAVGSQLDGDVVDSDERQGWRYFEYVGRFHNLFPTVYSIDDAIIFLLRSSYLMNSSLPSPTWMLIGATCRVFQDLGLHKMSPDNQNSQVNQEARNRLFWAAYLLDRQISIVFGRPTILQESDISVKLPGEIEPSGSEASGSDEETTCTFEEYQPNRLINSSEVALAAYRSLIATCRYFERVRVFQMKEGGSDNDMMRMRELDNELERVWESFPHEIINLDQSSGLEPCALRVLFDLQHARLLLYRSFADFSQNIRTACRTFCLSQSITVCKTSARLLLRCSRVQDWEINIARRTNETVRVHIFRAAAILLLGYHLKDPGIDRVEKEEVEIVLRSLKAVAQRKTMRKPYQMIAMAVRMFGFVPGFDMEISPSVEGQVITDEAEDAQMATAEPKIDPMDWRSSRQRDIPLADNRRHDPQLMLGSQGIQHQVAPSPSAENATAYAKTEQARWHGTRGQQQRLPEHNIQDPSRQITHPQNALNAATVVSHPPCMPHQHVQRHDMQSYNLLPANPAHPSHGFTPQASAPFVIPPLSQGESSQAALQHGGAHMGLNPLILSSDTGLDWNAFEDMMNSSSEYSHPGFGDLLARGPDLAWSYPLSSAQQLNDDLVGFAMGAQGQGAHQQHEQTPPANINLYQHMEQGMSGGQQDENECSGEGHGHGVRTGRHERELKHGSR